ncbi:MAG: glycosyltransferase, partial [Candidatus Omnitrophica bacterium]|nr:glycosyltransferase [Candidatus Omnitrophota bacterium]
LYKDPVPAILSVAGTGSLYKPLLEYIAKNGLEKRIKLVGHLSNITKIMLDSHFIIIPTIYEENCPVTSLEAQAHYLPCIYTNSGGLPETQINHKTGIMVSKNRPLEIVDAIKYLQSDLDRFNKMCLDARENSLNFTMDKMAKNYSDLYLGLFEK